MNRMRTTLLAAVAASLLVSPAAMSSPRSSGSSAPLVDETANREYVDRSMALVQLTLAPVTTAAKTKPAPGKKVDFNNSATKSYRARLSAQRNDFKQWLRANAKSAKVTGEYDVSLNAVALKLNGTALATLASAPMVARAEYQGVYYPTDVNDPDLELINAIEAWGKGGDPADAGKGVKVAVIDSGIDQAHLCFNGIAYPEAEIKSPGDADFINEKVVVAKVFNNKAKSRGYTAEAIDSHGTHVAGTIACEVDTPVDMPPYSIPYTMSGVAPAAQLGNYNVFPGDVADARSEDILNALDAAYADGFDVANMSLGGPFPGRQDLLTTAVDNLDLGNMVVAVSAGNGGPGHYTVGSPGSAARALTAGASEVGHGTKAEFKVDASRFAAVPGDFGTPGSEGLTRPIVRVTAEPVNAVTGYSEACSELQGLNLTGTIAIISRGTCDFSTKIRWVERAGAEGAVVVNRVPGEAPFIMGTGESPDGIQPTIPAYMISKEDGDSLKLRDGEDGTMIAPYYFDDGVANARSDFSSQGPTDVDFRVKPDLMAPGGNVLSSIPRSYCGSDASTCFAFFSGTSMASPHLAGAAAVVRSQHPEWSAAQVRSAITNTAAEGAVKTSSGLETETDVNIVGTGLLDVSAAVDARVALDPVSLSFGAVPSGSGQKRTARVTLTNLSGTALTVTIAVDPATPSGVEFSVAESTGTLAPGGSVEVPVTMAASKGVTAGDHQAFIRISTDGEEIAHAALYTFAK